MARKSAKLANWLDDVTDTWSDSTSWTHLNQNNHNAFFQHLLSQLNNSNTNWESRWSNWTSPSSSGSGSSGGQWHHNHGPQLPVDHPGTLTVTSDSPEGFVAGATITAHVSDPDGFKSGTFQWSIQNEPNGLWTNIDGGTSASITLTADQIGKQIDVTCTYTDNAGHVATVADPFTVNAPTTEPNPTPAPDQPGTLTVNSNGGFASGATITAAVSDADGVLQTSYEWFVMENGQWVPIQGATSASLTLADAQAGKDVEVQVSYTDKAGHSSVLTDTFSVDPLPPPPDQPGTLTVNSNGGFVSGAIVTATVTDPDQVDTANYQWLVSQNGQWIAIQGATASSFKLTDAQAGKDVEVQVSYTDKAGHSAVLTDTFTVDALPLPPPPPPNSPGAVTISSPNGLTEGALLTANVTDSDGLNASSVTYNWQENVNGSWLDIGSGQTHTIGFDEGGHQIRVLASYTDNAGHAEAPVSSPVNAIDVDRPGTLTVTSSSSSGFVQGATITTHLSDPDGVGSGPVSYQWSSMGSDGLWHDIAGATAATYTLTANDAGKQIDVTAHYTDAQGHVSTVTDPFSVAAPPSTGSSGTGATLLWSAEFNTPLDLKSASNPNGLWMPVDFWQNINSGGWEDFAGQSFNINPNNPTFAPYNPFSVENGYLQITASRTPDALVAPIAAEMASQGQPGPAPQWIGGQLITNKDDVTFTYGYFEFRERIPDGGKGMFPAMWFYSANESGDVQGKSTAEIDLYEVFGTPNQWHTNLHPGSEVGVTNADTAGWHTYGMLWEKDTLQFYEDGKLLYSATPQQASYFNDLKLSIRLDFSMDAPWFSTAAHSDSTTPSTMHMQIDYIRQYDHMPTS